jgi:hypothetical protein
MRPEVRLPASADSGEAFYSSWSRAETLGGSESFLGEMTVSSVSWGLLTDMCFFSIRSHLQKVT